MKHWIIMWTHAIAWRVERVVRGVKHAIAAAPALFLWPLLDAWARHRGVVMQCEHCGQNLDITRYEEHLTGTPHPAAWGPCGMSCERSRGYLPHV